MKEGSLKLILIICILVLSACGSDEKTESEPNSQADLKAAQRLETQGNTQEQENNIVIASNETITQKLKVLENQRKTITPEIEKELNKVLTLHPPISPGTVDLLPVGAVYQQDGSLSVLLLLRNGEKSVLTKEKFKETSIEIKTPMGEKIAEAQLELTDIGTLKLGEVRPVRYDFYPEEVTIKDYGFDKVGTEFIVALKGL